MLRDSALHKSTISIGIIDGFQNVLVGLGSDDKQLGSINQ